MAVLFHQDVLRAFDISFIFGLQVVALVCVTLVYNVARHTASCVTHV